MARKNARMRAKVKALAATREAFQVDQSYLQNGTVKSGLVKFNFSGSLHGPRLSPDYDRPMLVKGDYIPMGGRSNLISKPKPDAFIPDTSLGYTVARFEPENLDRQRKITRMCRKAFKRRHKGA